MTQPARTESGVVSLTSPLLRSPAWYHGFSTRRGGVSTGPYASARSSDSNARAFRTNTRVEHDGIRSPKLFTAPRTCTTSFPRAFTSCARDRSRARSRRALLPR